MPTCIVPMLVRSVSIRTCRAAGRGERAVAALASLVLVLAVAACGPDVSMVWVCGES
jgi:hypothetical protein